MPGGDLGHDSRAGVSASELRQRAIRAGYAGAERNQVAFALALVLDELGRHLRDLDEQVRRRVVELCGCLLGRRDVE